MSTEEKETTVPPVKNAEDEATILQTADPRIEIINELEEDIVRNDTIPETPKDTPGSNGAFAVGAFDTSKD